MRENESDNDYTQQYEDSEKKSAQDVLQYVQESPLRIRVYVYLDFCDSGAYVESILGSLKSIHYYCKSLTLFS